jgi:hypothetical protein
MTRHCHRCGTEWTPRDQPGRGEACGHCRADLRACRNCSHFDLRSAHGCRERRAEPVEDKESGNFCEWFEMARRPWSGGPSEDPRAGIARAALRDLLG